MACQTVKPREALLSAQGSAKPLKVPQSAMKLNEFLQSGTKLRETPCSFRHGPALGLCPKK
jgi:hypothetical protein